MEAAAMELELRLGTLDEESKQQRKEIEEAPQRNQEFLGGGGGVSALERWFTELGVSWVLQLDVGASPAALVLSYSLVVLWIEALEKIMGTIRVAESFFADGQGHGFVGMPGISEEEEVDSGKQGATTSTSLDPLQFALFFQEAMAKMLVFVDVVVSKSICNNQPQDTSSVFLNSCTFIHDRLSKALSGIRLQFNSSAPGEVEKIEKQIVSLLSAKQGKAFDAVWSSMEERRTRVLRSMQDSLGAETPQGSSDIHGATRSVMIHIDILLSKCRQVGPPLFASQAEMIAEMVSCLEEKLITKSQSFQDKGLGLLFLLNNFNFVRQQLQDGPSYMVMVVDLAAIISSITRRVEHYIESYIQVSWEPLLACLFNPAPLRLVRKYSPLSKFESEFQRIHSTQMLWKVPDLELRKRLRKAVIQKIIPGYIKYIEDSKSTNPRFTPQGLEEILQELFEGC